jgi:hypothetical protein
MTDPRRLLAQARTQTARRAQILANPEYDPDTPPQPGPQFLHYEDALNQFSPEELHIMTSMDPGELQLAVTSLAPFLQIQNHRGRREIFHSEDIILIILTWLCTGWKYKELVFFFKCDHVTIARVVNRYLAKFSSAACQLWIPARITDERDAQHFINFPEAIGAVDSTLIPIRIPKKIELKTELYSAKHKQHGFKLQVLVAPNEICLHLANLRNGTVHDKRIFDESDLPTLLKFRRTLASGGIVEARYPCLFDSGYQGLHHFYPEAILTQKKPINGDLTAEELNRNHDIHSDRVVVEHFFGHMKLYFAIVYNEFRIDHHLIEAVVFSCAALTNFLNRHRSNDQRPLRNIQAPPQPPPPNMPPPVQPSAFVSARPAPRHPSAQERNPRRASTHHHTPRGSRQVRKIPLCFNLAIYDSDSDDDTESDPDSLLVPFQQVHPDYTQVSVEPLAPEVTQMMWHTQFPRIWDFDSAGMTELSFNSES